MKTNNNNQKFIIRTDRAGVFFAEIKERRGSEADLVNARRIWRWEGAKECCQIGVDGISNQSKVTRIVPEMTVLGIIEIHPCSDVAISKIEALPEWTQ